MNLRDKLKTAAVRTLKEPTTGPPPVVGGPDSEMTLWDAVMGRQPESRRRDGVTILTGEEEIAAALDNMSEAQRAGYAAQAEIARQRQVPDVS